MSRRAKPRRLAPVVATADRGADGPAMAARRSYLVPGADAGVECRQMSDPSPLAGLRLEGRQLDAAEALRRLWRASLAGMVRPSAFRHGVASDEAIDEAEAAQAYRDYNDAITAVQWAAGLRAVAVLRSVVIHNEPTGEAGTLRLGLDALAMHLRL